MPLSTTQLLKKYDVPGPRYTSYPTVPLWSESVSSQDFSDHLGQVSSKDVLSLYCHIPFCEQLCHFCGCFKQITKDHSRSAPYVEYLIRELTTVAETLPDLGQPVCQIHFGGGTPNFLSPEELTKIMETVRRLFTLTDDAEVAIEMHPRTSRSEFCEVLKPLGFNRISLGVQDFDPHVQELIHRFQTFERTRAVVTELRDLGFRDFNFDLVYGLPGQTEKGFCKTLDQVLSLDPGRLAVYSYAHVPWKSPVQRAFQNSDLPQPDQKIRLFEIASDFFRQAGYVPIGMDHYAKPSDELTVAWKEGSLHRNFMGYTTRAEAHQVGVGLSAISFVKGHYFQNTKDMSVYQQALSQGCLTTDRGCLVTLEDQRRRAVITDLMCRLKIHKRDFFSTDQAFDDWFSEEIKDLQAFAQDGLVCCQAEEISVTPLGRLFLRNLAMVFDESLRFQGKTSQGPVFSQTV